MSSPRRLIEVDLPIKRISAHARREKSVRHGHISTLHIWWARRPLAACRAVICASLWPDPADPACPQEFREAAEKEMLAFAKAATTNREIMEICGHQSWKRYVRLVKRNERMDLSTLPTGTSPTPATAGDKVDSVELTDLERIRGLLLDFIADAAAWKASTNGIFLQTARNLTRSAHEAIGGTPGTRPLVVDPFAGGGAIPIEALRVGPDAFASDLNPVAVLLNKVVLEYIPKYGKKLADEIRTWGQWIKEEAEKELAEFYPKDPDGATPIAYLWARTVLSEDPGQGSPPIEVPLMRSMWLSKKASNRTALRWKQNKSGHVECETVQVTYVDGQTLKVRRPQLEVFSPKEERDVEPGTVARGSATCPVTGYTTKLDRVRVQLKPRRGGTADARLLCVVTTRTSERGRFYRLPTRDDEEAFAAAAEEMEQQKQEDETARATKKGHQSAPVEAAHGNPCSLVPDKAISLNELRRVSVPIYGMERWGDLFSPRQALALSTLARLVRKAREQMASSDDAGLAKAVQTCLALAVTKHADANCANCAWRPTSLDIGHLFGRQAIGMVWDFAEVNPSSRASRDFWNGVQGVLKALDSTGADFTNAGHIESAFATNHPLPDDFVAAFVTDPPYYDAVPYAYLSDFFYVWMRRMLADVHPALFREPGVPKDAEIVVDRPHQLSQSTKDIAFYERELTNAFAEGRRITQTGGVGTIVFASKTTASWEAILKAVVDAGWVIAGSWPIDTEMETRVAAQGQARLASSVHLVTRPRQNHDGSLRVEVGEWRDVLSELPKRIHQWMPRLAAEGVVGADAIFACLGPALEIFSWYSRVEKASGEVVPLREYLEHVWAAVSTEAMSMIFKDADAAGLEPDARLTAMWLWTLGVGTGRAGGNGNGNKVVPGMASENDAAEPAGKVKSVGFTLEFDAARKIAQGLGIHLEKSESFVEVKGDKARLLPVAERTKYLFGKDSTAPAASRRRRKPKQKSLFDELDEIEAAEAGAAGKLAGASPRETVLDGLHQAMILFGAGRGDAVKRFLVDDGVGSDTRFWRLAQSLSALYPPGCDEKRWVDGVLARKKGLGF
ncbi:MAG: DUF1156 domain-containing protein [Pirellulaceae bacterium]